MSDNEIKSFPPPDKNICEPKGISRWTPSVSTIGVDVQKDGCACLYVSENGTTISFYLTKEEACHLAGILMPSQTDEGGGR